jgi:drug/metabolite transporter (DMT)-like permease
MVVAPSSIIAFCGAIFVACQAISIKHASAKARETMATSPAFVAAFMTIVVSVVIFWALLLAQGIQSGAFALANAAPFVVTGALNPAVFRLLYFKGIDEVGAPIAAALMAMNPVVASIFAVPVLGETVTIASGLGILFIVGGGVIIQSVQNAADVELDGDSEDVRGDSGGNVRDHDELDLVARQLAAADTRSLLAPIAAMVVLGISYVIITVGLRGQTDPVSGLTIAQTTAFVGFLAIIAGSPRIRSQLGSLNRPAFGLFLIAGVFTASAQIASFFALDIGTVVTVIPLFNTFPLLVLALTYAIAREVPRSVPILVGVISIVVGSVLVEIV